MVGAGVGREDGRASALEVLLPLKRGGRLWIVLWLGLLRTVLPLRRWAFRELDDLRFVYALRWSLLPPFEPPRRARARPLRPEQRWHLLFQSNFDGDWDDYLESFATVMPKGLASVFWVGVGYPGLADPALFKAYAKAHDHLPEHYASAYVDLTAGDVRREVAERYGRAAARAIDQVGYADEAFGWTNLVLPLRRGTAGAAVRAARDLEPPAPDGGGPGPAPVLLRAGHVHFARVVVLRQPTRSWLLLTLTHDADAEPLLHELLARDAEAVPGGGPPAALRRLVALVRGMPDPDGPDWDGARAVQLLLDHRPSTRRHDLAYCAYPGFRVADVLAMDAAPRRHDRYPDGDEVVP